MNSTYASCGCLVPAVGSPGSIARRRCERLPCSQCAETAVIVKVRDRQFRAVTFPGGQRTEMWLPRGTYIVGEVCNLTRGRDETGPDGTDPARQLTDSAGDM